MTNDNEMIHQGKTIAQWEKDFKGQFTCDQLMKMAKGGCDLQKMLVLGLDEAEDIGEDDYSDLTCTLDDFISESDEAPKFEFALYDNAGKEVSRNTIDQNDATFFNLQYLSNCMDDFNDAAKAMPNSPHQTAMIYVDGQPLSKISSVRMAQIRRLCDSMNESSDEDAALAENEEDIFDEFIGNNEALGSWTGFIKLANNKTIDIIVYGKDEDAAKQEALDFIESHKLKDAKLCKLVPRKSIDESIDIVTVKDMLSRIKTYSNPNDKVMLRVGKKPYDITEIQSKGGVTTIDLTPTVLNEVDDNMDDANMTNEGRNWRTGGYGGTGRSYRSFGEIGAPRGKAISWFAISDIDPKAKGKMHDWRMGPSNFPFKDLLYPERNYKIGTTVLRSKFLKAGDESGVKYIAIPSYFDAIKNIDQEAINLMTTLGIPLDLTFGMDPNDDYSSTYTSKAN